MSRFEEYEKRFGKHLSSELNLKNQPQTNNEEEGKMPIILYPFLFIRFIFQLFVAGPDVRWQNPIPVILMGLFLFFFNGYILLVENDLITDFVEIFIDDTTTKKGVAGFIGLLLIIQCLRAIFIVGGWNQISDGKPLTPEQKKRLASLPDTRPVTGGGSSYSNQEDEFQTVRNIMNQKMAQMSNSQKIDYLKDFYGGNKEC